MLIVLSPAKALDYEAPPSIDTFTRPDFLDHSAELIDILRECSPTEIARLMHLSDPLAALNVARYAQWHAEFTPANAKQVQDQIKADLERAIQQAPRDVPE